MSLFGNFSTGGSVNLSGGLNFSNTNTNLFDNKLNKNSNALTTNLFNSSQNTNNLFNLSNNNTGIAQNSLSISNINQGQSIVSNMLNLPLQQRQELERIEKRKISLQKGLSLQMNPSMTALTYQLDEKAEEKQQEVDNFIYYNLNDEDIINNLNNAKKLNPNPSKCYTLPIKGFGELVQREQQQRKELENLLCEMKSVKDENVKILQKLNTITLKRIEECKKRHQNILHQLVHISCMIEDYGEKNSFAQINYQLDNQLNQVLYQIQENHMRLGIWQSSINQIETNIKCIDEHLSDNDTKYSKNIKDLFENVPKQSNANGVENGAVENSENNSNIDLNKTSNNPINGQSENKISRESNTNIPSNVEAILETLENQQQLFESLDDTVRNDLQLIQQFISKV